MSEEETKPYYPLVPDHCYRFVDALGSGFAMGMAGSSFFNFFGGLRRGGGLAGAARAISARAPRAAGTMAAYFALYSALESTMDLARPNKEDLWNAVAAGAVSWAAVGVRRGAPGAAIVAVGLANEFFDGRLEEEKPPRQQPQPLYAPTTPAAPDFLGRPPGPPIFVQEVSVASDQRM